MAAGVSGRNGSMCTQGITISPAGARKRYGQGRARELYNAFREVVDVVEELTHTENIDCDFGTDAVAVRGPASVRTSGRSRGKGVQTEGGVSAGRTEPRSVARRSAATRSR